MMARNPKSAAVSYFQVVKSMKTNSYRGDFHSFLPLYLRGLCTKRFAFMFSCYTVCGYIHLVIECCNIVHSCLLGDIDTTFHSNSWYIMCVQFVTYRRTSTSMAAIWLYGILVHMYLHVHVSDNTRGTWFEYMSDWAKFTENPANNAHLVVYEDLKQVNNSTYFLTCQYSILFSGWIDL